MTEVVKNPEHEKLIEILKFTPCTYKVQLYGYGGEYVMGTVDRKIYDYFKKHRIDLSDYAWDHGDETKVPEDMQPFYPGSWYDCDDMVHAWGVDRNAGTLQVIDNNDMVIYEFSTDSIDGCEDDAPSLQGGDEFWIDMKDPGTVVFLGTSSEKGTFFEGNIELTAPFDITKLSIEYSEIDGNEVITGVYYNEEQLDNFGGDTSGKSSDFGFYIAGSNKHDGKGYEKYRNMDDIEYPMTDWFSKKINPVRNGLYMIKTAGRNSYTHQAKWTGTRWISSWQEDTEGTEEIKIKEWQGLAIDPDLEENTNG